MKAWTKILLFVFALPWCNFAHAQGIKFSYTYGEMSYNYGIKVIQSADKGYYILGNISAASGNARIEVIRTDSLGIILWEKTIGNGPVYHATDFIRTTDGNFLICGFTDLNFINGYDVLLIKTDSLMNPVWEKTYGGTDWDFGNSVCETFDHNFIIAGETFSYGPGANNVYILGISNGGDTLWTRVFGGDSSDYATSLDMMPDSTCIVGGATNSFGAGSFDGWVIRLDMNGDSIFSKTLGEDKEDIIYSIKHTSDSGFVFAGSTMSYTSVQRDSWLMKFNKSGTLQWKMPEPWEIGSGDDVTHSLTVDDSGCYILTGYTTGAGHGKKEMIMTRMADNNVFKCSLTAGSTEDEESNYAVQTADQGFIIAGYSNGLGPGMSDIYIVKTGPDCSTNSNHIHILGFDHQEFEEYQGEIVYPTISAGLFHIKTSRQKLNAVVEVYDLQGRSMFLKTISLNSGSVADISLNHLSDGMYIITLRLPDGLSSYKILKYSNDVH